MIDWIIIPICIFALGFTLAPNQDIIDRRYIKRTLELVFITLLIGYLITL